MSFLPVQATHDDWVTVTYVNPDYQHLTPVIPVQGPYSSNAAVAATTSTIDETIQAVRDQMKVRNGSFTIQYSGDFNVLDDSFWAGYGYNKFINYVLNMAIYHTGTPTEGDYLYRHLMGWTVDSGECDGSGAYNWCGEFTFTYLDTAAQQAEMNSAFTTVMDSLGLSGKTDYEKIEAIYSWITANITYDHTQYADDATENLKYTAYAALVKRLTVCQGYSSLFYRMCLAAGVDTRVIRGFSFGENHAWNIAKVGSYYYNLDSTWDAGYSKSSWSYFLKSQDDFADHTRRDEYATESFMSAYPMDSNSYAEEPADDPDVETYGTCSWAISNGTLTIQPVSGSSCTLDNPDWTNDPQQHSPWYGRSDVSRIVINGSVKAGSSAWLLFGYLTNLTDVSGLSSLDVSNVTRMWATFAGCRSLSDLTGLGSWDVSHVTNMQAMFNDCDALSNLSALSSWNVSRVTNMFSMFCNDASLTDLTPLQNWNVSSVTDMGEMFQNCAALSDISSLEDWSVSNVTDFHWMFLGTKANAEDIAGWAISDTADTNNMFPAAVSGLKASVSGTTAKLSWSAFSNAESYEVWRSTSASSGFAKIADITETSYTDSGVSGGKTYYYKVRAQITNSSSWASDDTYSEYSSVVKAAIPVLQMSGVKATVSGNTAAISWSKLSGAATYYVYQSTSSTSGFANVGSSTSTSYKAAGLNYGKTYYFKVRAKMSTGDYSQYSAVVKAVIPVPQMSGVKATVSGNTAAISWSKLSGAKTYYVYQSTSSTSGFKNIGSSTSTSYKAAGLNYGKTYYFKVRAKMSTGDYSSYSAVVKAVISVPQMSGVKATVSGNTAAISWSKLSGAKTYSIYQSTSSTSGFKNIGSSTSTSYKAAGLNYGKTYYFKVRAKMSTGDYSSYSAVVKAAVPVPQVSGLKAELSGKTAKLSWSKLSGAKTYYIYRSTSATSGFEKIGSASSTSYSAKNLKEGKTYYFKVRAKLSTGDYSKYSTVVAAGQLTGLKAKVSGTTAKLSWTKLSGAKTYFIYQSTSKTSGFKKVASTTGTSYSVKSLTKGKTYYFKVRAKLSTGDYSAYAAVVKAAISNKKSAALASVQSVAPVQKLSAAVSGQSVKLSWEKLSGAKSYEVYRSASAKSGFEKIGTTEKTSCKITKQSYGKTLYFKVRALLSDGSYSEFSTAVKAVLPAAPTTVPTAAPTVVPTAAPTAVSVKPAANAANTNAGNITEECSADGSSCTIVEKVCTETECTITSKVCVVIGDQKACAEPVVTVVPVLPETPVVTVTPTVEVTPTEEAAATETPAVTDLPAEVTEECSEDGSTCTVYEKVCTEAECTITSKVCVVIGDQKACAEPMVTVVPVMTETPAMTEDVPAEPTATEEAPAEPAVTEEIPAEPTVTEEIPAEPTATEEIPAEPAMTEEVPEEPAVTEEAPAEPAATEVTPEEPTVTEETPAEPTVTEEAPAEPVATEVTPEEPTATEEAPAEPTMTEEAPAEPAVTEEIPAEPAVTEESPAEPTATEEAPAEPVVTEEVPTEPAVTEEIPTEPVAAEEIPAAKEAVSVDAAPVEDLTIREISIEDLTEDTIAFSALESYTIAPEKLKIVPEAADWAELAFKLDDESIASFKSTDIEVIKAEGLTLNGLQAGSTTLRIQAGEVEKAVTLVINLPEAESQEKETPTADAE